MELLTPKEAADLLKVTPRTVSIWLKEGKLPGYKLGLGCRAEWRINREDLELFLRAHANATQIWWDKEKENMSGSVLNESEGSSVSVVFPEKSDSDGDADRSCSRSVQVSDRSPEKSVKDEGEKEYSTEEIALAWHRYSKHRYIP